MLVLPLHIAGGKTNQEGNSAMFTKFFSTAAVVLSMLFFSVSESHANYFVHEWIGGIHYLVEYLPDGSIFQLIPQED